MFKPHDTRERILHRLQISLGHLKKVIRMVEEGNYCIDILHQSEAVQKALHDTDGLILENHLKTCVRDKMKKGSSKEAISEIIAVWNKK